MYFNITLYIFIHFNIACLIFTNKNSTEHLCNLATRETRPQHLSQMSNEKDFNSSLKQVKELENCSRAIAFDVLKLRLTLVI